MWSGLHHIGKAVDGQQDGKRRTGCRRHSAKAETHTAAHGHRMRITVAVSLAFNIRMMVYVAHGVFDATGSCHGPMVQGHAGYDRDKNCEDHADPHFRRWRCYGAFHGTQTRSGTRRLQELPALKSSTGHAMRAERRRREFPITLTDDSAMAAAAMAGESVRPINGYRTPAATGTPAAL